jgi:hypothetical protein
MKKVYKQICNRCRAVTMEMSGTVIEDSFDAAMNPFRVFVSPDKVELWCDECIEHFARFCPTHISDQNRPTHYYSPAHAESLFGKCPFCELSLVSHQPRPASIPCQGISRHLPIDDSEWDEIEIPSTPIISPTFHPVPVLRTDVQLLFRTPPSKKEP